MGAQKSQDMHMCFFSFFACAMSCVMFPCWQACNLSSFSLLLHCMCVHRRGPSQPAITLPPATPGNPHPGTVFTRASEVPRYVVQIPDAVRALCANFPFYCRSRSLAEHLVVFVASRVLTFPLLGGHCQQWEIWKFSEPRHSPLYLQVHICFSLCCPSPYLPL